MSRSTKEPATEATSLKSTDYRLGYANGYAAVMRQVAALKNEIKRLRPINTIAAKVMVGNGYVCRVCRVQRPSDWFYYEVEHDEEWLAPCCAICARKNNSRGPFKQPTTNHPAP